MGRRKAYPSARLRIQKDSSGKYRTQIEYCWPGSIRKKESLGITFKNDPRTGKLTKAEKADYLLAQEIAQKKREEFLAQVHNLKRPQSEPDLLKIWPEVHPKNAGCLEYLKRFCKTATLPVKVLTPDFIEQFIDFLKKQNLSPNTVNRYYALLRSIYNKIRKRYRLESADPFQYTSAPRKQEPERLTLTVEQIRLLWAKGNEAGEPFRETALIYMSQCLSGLRVSDAITLTKAEILAGQKRCQKTKKLTPLPSQHPMFQELLLRPDEKVFSVHPKTYARNLKKLCELAGVPIVGSHSARRAHHLILRLSGADLTTIRHILGHSSIVETQKYESILSGEAAQMQRKAADYLTDTGRP